MEEKVNAIGLEFRDTLNRGMYYHDMRFSQDDKRILRNPHKGWYWHYVDNGFGRGAYRTNHDQNDLLLDFPGLNHLYLRFDWSDIEREEGRYDWSEIDAIIDKWGTAGYRFSFRVCTYEASSKPESLAYATPKWVFDAGASGNSFRGAWEPDYGDPVFLDKLTGFMSEFGKRFNGHPLVETVDIGTFGTWGEGHSAFGSDKSWPLEVMKKHIDLHSQFFPDTFLLFNDDMINSRNDKGDEENIELMLYARNAGVGIRDDSLCVRYYADRCGYNTIRTPFMFDYFYDSAPTDLEFDHYNSMPSEYFRDGFPFLDAMIRTRCTFAGFHGYPRPWLESQYYFTEYVANRLGYWYFLEGAEIPSLPSGRDGVVKFLISNRGFAKAYWKFDVKVKLVNSECEYIIPLDIDNRRWQPGQCTEEIVRLNLRDVESGQYKLFFGLFDGVQEIELGMKKDLIENGYCLIGELVVY